MLKIIEHSAKTSEEALNKCLEECNASTKEVYIEETITETGILKKKKYKIKVIEKSEIKNFIKQYIKDLSEKMNLVIKTEIKENDAGINILLISNNNPLLIGKEGRNLNAIQLILRQTVQKYGNFNIKINVDASNYKQKKESKLKYEIKQLAKEVKNSKIEVKLDPMNSYERRIVHTIVSQFKELETESAGEEPQRYVIIKYIDTDTNN